MLVGALADNRMVLAEWTAYASCQHRAANAYFSRCWPLTLPLLLPPCSASALLDVTATGGPGESTGGFRHVCDLGIDEGPGVSAFRKFITARRHLFNVRNVARPTQRPGRSRFRTGRPTAEATAARLPRHEATSRRTCRIRCCQHSVQGACRGGRRPDQYQLRGRCLARFAPGETRPRSKHSELGAVAPKRLLPLHGCSVSA